MKTALLVGDFSIIAKLRIIFGNLRLKLYCSSKPSCEPFSCPMAGKSSWDWPHLIIRTRPADVSSELHWQQPISKWIWNIQTPARTVQLRLHAAAVTKLLWSPNKLLPTCLEAEREMTLDKLPFCKNVLFSNGSLLFRNKNIFCL